MRRIPTRTIVIAFALASAPLAGRAQDNSFTNQARKAGGATTAAGNATAGAASGQDSGAAEAQPAEQTAPADGSMPPPAGGTPADKLSAASATAATLDTYTIQRGDTLWDICARMLGDPFFWPKLWTFNQYITNPHWIYPGNVLSFKEGTETTPPQFEVTKPDAVAAQPMPATAAEPVAAAESTPVPAQPVQAENLQEGFSAGTAEPVAQPVAKPEAMLAMAAPMTDNQTFEVNLRQEGFISETELPALGILYKSESERADLAEYDDVYLRFQDPGQAQVGKQFTIYRTLHRVKHPNTRGYVGFLIKILAQVKVTSVDGNVATAHVDSSYDVIHRGDSIMDYVDVLKQVNVAPNGAQVDGTVIESMNDGVELLGSGDVIYIDKGQQDGLKIGNTLDVVRKADGSEKVRLDYSDQTLPSEIVARLVVVGTRERTATAVVMGASDAIRLGDKVRMAPN